MEDKLKNSTGYLDNHLTPRYCNRLQNKRFNFKKQKYRNRLTFGKLAQAGIVNEMVRTLPWVFRDEVNKGEIIENIKAESNNLTNDEESYFFNRLLNDSEFNLTVRPSKRELLLRSMLNDRLNKLSHNLNND
jgi:hypothetical protein